MGEARRRGTKEQRIAAAIERRKLEDVAREERSLQAIREKHERTRELPPEERKVAIMESGSSRHRSRLLMAAAAGLLAMPTRK